MSPSPSPRPRTSSRRTARPARAALPALLLAALSLGLSGCLSEDDEEPRVSTGQGLSTLEGVASAAVLDGKLYVGNRADSAMGIAVIDLDADTLLAFHGETLQPNQVAAAGDSVLVISESNYSVGALSSLSAKTGAFDTSYLDVNSDNALSADGDRVFLLERGKSVVTGFTGGKLTDASVFLNVNTGSGTNPHQVALSGQTAFITRYNSTHLLVAEADVKDGGKLDSIDLSDFVANTLKDSAGAVPRMDGAAVYGKRLFVTVQRLGPKYQPTDTSKVVVIDVDTREVIGAIPLRARNPISNSARGKYLYVSCAGAYGVADGAVERIDMEQAAHAGLVVEESELKRPTDPADPSPSDLIGFVPTSDTRGYVLYAPDFESSYIQPLTLP